MSAVGYCYDSEPDCPGKPIKEKELKREKIEIKELKPEHKELKVEKPEHKEIKLEKIESKELKAEIKEQPEKLLPDKLVPDKGPFEGPSGDPFQFGERLAGVEAAVGQLAHFIGPQLRPDLSQGALAGEPGATAAGGPAGTKPQKDAKDLEKLREG